MTKQVQLRRGTTAEHEVFTGAEGELTINTDKDVAVVHDGVTVGGHELVGVSAAGQTIVNKDGIAIGTSTLVPGSQLTVQGNTYVSGISTFVGVGTFSGDLYVGGDLYVADDLFFDELTARNANITGIGTIETLDTTTGTIDYLTNTNLNVSGIGTIETLDTTTGTIDYLTNTNLNVSGIGTIETVDTTTGTIDYLTNTNLNVSGIGTIETLKTNVGVVTSISGTNISYSGIGTIETLDTTTGTIDYLTNTNLNVSGIGTIETLKTNVGVVTSISGTNISYSGIGTIETLDSTNSSITNINSSGISTLGVTSTTNLTAQRLNVSGISTFAGINTARYVTIGLGSTDLTVDGNARVTDTLTAGNGIFNNLNSVGITTVEQLIVSGLNFPTIDGQKGQVLTTDGAGNVGFTTGAGGSNVILRVSSKTGSDNNDGKILPLATIKKATQLASLVGEPTTILVETGEYIEDNPIIVYDEVSIIGDSLRNIIVRPLNAGKDLLRVRNGCYITGMTFNDYINPTTGVPQHTYNYSVSFDDPYDLLTDRTGYAAVSTVNVTNAVYTPSVGILTVTTATPHELYSPNSVRLSGLAFTCGYDEVGISTFVYTNTTGVSTCTTVNVHGLSTGSKVFLAGLAFTCATQHAGVTTTIFPDGTSEYGRIFTVTSVGSATTFTFNAGISTIAHNYVSGGTVQKALIYPESNSDGKIDFGVVSVASSTTFTVRVGVTTVPHYYTQDGTARLSKPIINKSPYIQNCSILSFLGGNGILVDGNKIANQNNAIIPELGEIPAIGAQPEFGKSMVAATFTMVSFGGIGWRTINDGYAQVVSCFQIFCRYGSLTQSGGYLSITNSATNFGNFALRSTGFSPNSFIFDRGRVATTGTKDGLQTLKVIGLGRTDQDLYVLQLFDNNLINRTGNFKPVVVTQQFSGSQISTTTNIFNISGHPFNNLDSVVYLGNEDDATPQVISGMVPGNQYYVSYIDSSNFYLYQDEGLQTLVTIGSTFVGINTLSKNNQEFFVKEMFDTHNSYQTVSLASTSSTLKFISGRQVIQAVSGGNAVGFALTFNSTSRQLIVSVEAVTGVRRFFSASGGNISDHNTVPVSIGVTNVSGITTYRTIEFKVDSTDVGTVIAGINTIPENYYLHFHRPSIINSSGHTWEYSGSGIDYNALPQNGGKSDPLTEQVAELGGRVYASGTNELGDFKIGDQIIAFNRTGNIVFNNKVTIGQLDSIRLSLSGGIAVEEFSTDVNLGESEIGGPKNTRVSTQLAVRSFLSNRLGTFIDRIVSTNAIPNAVVQLNSAGQINPDLIPPKIINFNVTNIGSGRTMLVNQIPAINILQGDTVVEPLDSYVLINDVLSQYLILDSDERNYNFNNGNIVNSSLTGTVTGIVTTPPRGLAIGVGTVGYVDYNYIGYGTTGLVKGVMLGGIINVAGSGYNVSGIYTGVQLLTQTGIGTNATANITVTAGTVTNVDIHGGGRYYASGNVVSAAATALGGRTGGSDFQFTINNVETRLYVSLTNNQKFSGSPALADYIADNDAVGISTILTTKYEVSFTPTDISVSGNIDFNNDRIIVGAGNSFVSGDPIIYDSNGGSIISAGGLGIVNLTTYYVKVVGAGTSVELHRTYQLNDLLDLTGSGTGTHKLSRAVVNVETDTLVRVGHGYSTGTPIRVTGSTPIGIDTSAFYYVGSVTNNSFTFHATQSDALFSVNGVTFNAIGIGSTSTGTITLTKQNVRYTSVVNTSSTSPDNWSLLARDSIDASNIVSGVISPTRLGTGSANSDTILTGSSEYKKNVFSVGIGTTQPLGTSSFTSVDFAPGGVGVNTYYGAVNLTVTRAAGSGDLYSTLGVARFKTSTFSVDTDGNVQIKNSLTGDIDAVTLGGQTGTYYLNVDNHTGSIPISRGGTGQSALPANGAILIGNGSAYSLTTAPTFTGRLTSTLANDVTTGQIYLNGATGNRIDFNTNGVAVPTYTTRSVGTKIVLYPAIAAASADYGFGIESATLWSSVPTTSQQFKWYGGTTLVATLTGAGAFTVTSTIQGTQLISTIATGTAPLTVASATLVANLNADNLDGVTWGNVNTNIVTSGDLAVNGGDVTTTSATASVFDTTATTVNAFRAATALNLATIATNPNINIATTDSTGTTTVGNNMAVRGRLQSFSNTSATAWTNTGISFDSAAATFTNTSAAGTYTPQVANSFNTPIFASTNLVTVTDASTVYISNRPTAGTNTTITNGHALYIAGGRTFMADAGSAAIPSLAIRDRNTGLYSSATSTLDVTTGGILAATFGSTGNLTVVGDIVVNGGDVTTTSVTASIFDATATTVNAFGAATTFNLGYDGPSVSSTTNINTGANASGITKAINIGTGGVAGSTTTITLGTTAGTSRTLLRSATNNIYNATVLGATTDEALRGPITALTTTPTAGGTGYRDGVHLFNPTGGTGSLVQVTASVGGGIVRSVVATPPREGRGYTTSDSLTLGVPVTAAIPTTAASGDTVTATLTFNTQSQLATTAASGTGVTATLTFAAQTVAPYPVGSTITVSNVTPIGYNGTFVVTSCTTIAVSYANVTTGAQTVAGTVSLHPFTLGGLITVAGVTPTGYNATNVAVTAQTATTVSYANVTTGAQTVAGTINQGTALTNATIATASVRQAGLNIINGTYPRIRLENTNTAVSAGTEFGSVLFGCRDVNLGGSGDKVRLIAAAEGTSGGGQLQLWTSVNGEEPTLGFLFGGNNDFRLYNSTGTFYHTFVNAPTANRTITLPDANISFANAFTTSGAFALTLTTTAATNVTLPTTGTLATLGGVETFSAAKTFSDQIISTRANSTITGGGQIYLNGATGNRIDFNTNGVAAPAFTTRSAGTKLVLYPGIAAAAADYGFGIESATLWSSVPTAAEQFRWYGGTTLAATLSGAGAFTATSTIQGTRLISTIVTGTAPLTVASTTLVTNLNADLLDGISSESFFRSDTSNSALGGVFRFRSANSIDVTNTGEINGLQVFQPFSATDALMSFHVSGDFACHFGLSGGLNDLVVGGWSFGAVEYRIWHAGNDGSGSGLDADLLDGLNSATANTVSTIVARDASGNFSAGTITAALSGNSTTATTLQTARTINNVSFNGSSNIVVPTIFDSSNYMFTNPGGGQYVTQTATVTGAIAITFPVGMTNTMIRLTIKVYEYTTNESFEIHCGGYSYNVGNTWANNPYAYIVGNPNSDRRFTVRFGYTSGARAIIYIGELASTWSYPQVFITEVQCGYSGFANSFASGWAISFETTAFQSVTATIANPQVGFQASTNTANSVVLRDASGNFSAGTITAALSGNATTATSATSSTFLNSSNYIQRTGSSANLNTDFQNTPAGSTRIQGDDSSLTNSPGGTWWFYQNMRHSNASNFWGTQVAWGWEDNANRLRTRNVTSGTFGSWVNYWNDVNDGSGSGLDADLLDGLNSATANTVSTIVARDASGNFSAGTVSVTSVSASGNILSGTGTSGAVATPPFLNMGANYSNTTLRANCKIRLYQNAADIYGFGIGANGDIQYHSTTSHQFYNSDVATVLVNANGLTVSGDRTTLYGPNSTWAASLRIGGNGNADTTNASVVTTNGNLHLDSKTGAFGMYLNYYKGTSGVAFGNGASAAVAWMGSDGDLWKGSADNTGSVYWHAGNDGSGSGLDADLLDGISSASFLRSDANATATGAYLFSKNNPAISNTSYATTNNHIELRTGDGSNPIIGFHRAGFSATALYHSNYGIDSLRMRNADGNDGPIFSTFNDGSGSGLDADLWDGYQLSMLSNWATNSAINIVVGQLSWKNYGNYHTIFDASNSTSPYGGAVNNTNSQVAWTGTYPTLMGWNGSNTYGVRVDSCRLSDSTSGPSDRRLKENLKHIESPLEKVQKLNGYTFDWNEKSKELNFIPKDKKNDVGLIAQEVIEVLPQAVEFNPFDQIWDEENQQYVSKSGENYLNIKYERLVPLLVEAIKEQQEQINTLKNQVQKLSGGEL